MKKYLLFGSGWFFLGLFLLSGFYFNKFSAGTDGSIFRPVEWGDHMQLFEGVIQCNLTDEDLLKRRNKRKMVLSTTSTTTNLC